MRYLVHSGDASFDSTDNKYYFNLERRIANPRRIRITQVSYTAATSTAYPEVVYLRSSKLAQLTKTKHTVELKNEGHYDSSDVISTLTETHSQGRYSSNRATMLHVFEHVPIRKLDFYFTDNRTALTHGSQSSTVTVTPIAVGPSSTIRMSYVLYDPQNNVVLTVNDCRPVQQIYHHSGSFYTSTDTQAPAYDSSIHGGVLWMQTGNGDITTTGDRGLFVDQFGGTSFGYSTMTYSGLIDCNLFNVHLNTVPVPKHHVSFTYNAQTFTGFDMSNDIISPTNTDDENGLKFPKNNYPNYLEISSNNPNGYYMRITYNEETTQTTQTITGVDASFFVEMEIDGTE